MMPQSSNTALIGLKFETSPSLTYAIDLSTNKISGMADGLESVKQAIYLILNTERYQHIIYSWNYGVELSRLIGQPIELILPEIKRHITEALLQDDRITSVDNFAFEVNGKKVHCSFRANTIFGELKDETEVSI